MKNYFISVEGLEGAGKSTAIAEIIHLLNEWQIFDIQTTREPGGTPLAEKMRTLIKQGDDNEPLTDMAELLLLYAARVQLVDNVIKPALAKGAWVIGDRHDMSSQAYQGGGRGFNKDLMLQMRDMVLGDFQPDLTIYMDIDPKQGLARASMRGELDRIEKMDLSFFERTRARYLELAQKSTNVITVSAGNSIEQVTAEIRTKLGQWLQEHCEE